MASKKQVYLPYELNSIINKYYEIVKFQLIWISYQIALFLLYGDRWGTYFTYFIIIEINALGLFKNQGEQIRAPRLH